jgi:hypothetical protein
MGVVYGVGMLLSARQPRLVSKLALASTVSGVIVLPWAWWSGFLRQTTHIPPARQLLDLDALVHSFPCTDPVVLSTGTVGIAWPDLDCAARRPGG